MVHGVNGLVGQNVLRHVTTQRNKQEPGGVIIRNQVQVVVYVQVMTHIHSYATKVVVRNVCYLRIE